MVVTNSRPTAPAGDDAFVHPLPDLQPVGVVVAYETVGPVEDRLVGAVVFGEDDGRGLGVVVHEA